MSLKLTAKDSLYTVEILLKGWVTTGYSYGPFSAQIAEGQRAYLEQRYPNEVFRVATKECTWESGIEAMKEYVA